MRNLTFVYYFSVFDFLIDVHLFECLQQISQVSEFFSFLVFVQLKLTQNRCSRSRKVRSSFLSSPTNNRITSMKEKIQRSTIFEFWTARKNPDASVILFFADVLLWVSPGLSSFDKVFCLDLWKHSARVKAPTWEHSISVESKHFRSFNTTLTSSKGKKHLKQWWNEIRRKKGC